MSYLTFTKTYPYKPDYKHLSLYTKWHTLQRIFYDDEFYNYNFEELCLSIKLTLELNPTLSNCQPFLSFIDVPIEKGAVKLWLVLHIERPIYFY